MGRIGFYVPGQWNFQCDQCGVWWKSADARLRWDNARVCPKCFEIRNPQDFVRGKKDVQTTPWSRPVPTQQFIYIGDAGQLRLLDSYLIGQKTFG
jgi:hypothetical protein